MVLIRMFPAALNSLFFFASDFVSSVLLTLWVLTFLLDAHKWISKIPRIKFCYIGIADYLNDYHMFILQTGVSHVCLCHSDELNELKKN